MSVPLPRSAGPGRRRARVAWLFMVPLVAVNLLVIVAPAAATVWYAFTDWSGVGAARFVGLANFRQLLGDLEFHQAGLHYLTWTAFFLTVPIAMGLLGAFLLSRIRRFQVLFRIAYFIPYVIASVVNGAIWQNLLDPVLGLGAQLDKFGIPLLRDVNFLGNPSLALPTVAFVDNWHFWGFLVVLFLAAMGSVDRSLYEAARVDGATTWREFWHITLPGIRATLLFVALMTIIWSLLAFDYVYILTQGGPAGATELISTLLYKQAFTLNEAGYAAAMGVGMTSVVLVVVGVYLWLRRRGWEV
jgi:raffinose/stachyose/melibiose transport system permease protein